MLLLLSEELLLVFFFLYIYKCLQSDDFISDPSCVLESVSQNPPGPFVVVRTPAGPAELCRCQSPQEECLERETA